MFASLVKDDVTEDSYNATIRLTLTDVRMIYMNHWSEKVSFIWSIAELLRGPYRKEQ